MKHTPGYEATTGKSTPGPWTVHKGHTYLVHGTADPNTSKPYGFVCSVGWTSTGDGRDNAYLIAALPELLEACEAWEGYAKECENKIAPDYAYQRILRDKAKELGRKAIAKVEGKD